MLGKMMDQPLLISNLIAHAGRYHGATEVVSVETTGGIERADWSRLERNARRLASALERLWTRLTGDFEFMELCEFSFSEEATL